MGGFASLPLPRFNIAHLHLPRNLYYKKCDNFRHVILLDGIFKKRAVNIAAAHNTLKSADNRITPM
jgi:hypothetical protein